MLTFDFSYLVVRFLSDYNIKRSEFCQLAGITYKSLQRVLRGETVSSKVYLRIVNYITICEDEYSRICVI